MNLLKIREHLEDVGEQTLVLDGFDECAVGFVYNNSEPVIIYSKQKIITQLMNDLDSETGEDLYAEAMEYYEYNIANAYMGPTTPLLMEHLV